MTGYTEAHRDPDTLVPVTRLISHTDHERGVVRLTMVDPITEQVYGYVEFTPGTALRLAQDLLQRAGALVPSGRLDITFSIPQETTNEEQTDDA